MQKKVSFKNTKGQQLVGVLHIPRGQGPFPAVIVQHGYRGTYNNIQVKAVAKGLEKAGFIVLRFTFSGHPPSGGTYQEVAVPQLVRDIKCAIQYLKRISLVNQHRLGIFGHSLGALVALFSSALYRQDIRAVVSLACPYDFGAVMATYFRDNKVDGVGKDYWVVSGFKTSKTIYHNRNKFLSDIHCPVLIIHGHQDKRVQFKDAHSIYNLLKEPKKLEIIKGADHNFINKKQLQKVVNSTVSWCKQYLAFKESKIVNALIQYQDKILLLKRSQKVGTHPGYWSGVGGYMDKGESAIVTAQREVSEELKIPKAKLKNYYLGRTFKLDDRAFDRIWLVHPILFRLKSKPPVKLDWENSKYRWVKLSEVQRYKLIPTMPRALKELRLINK